MSTSDLTLFDRASEENPRRWVTVSNEMIMARLDWDIMMHRILMVLISQIDSKEDERFRTQRVPARRIRDMAQVTQKSIHEEAGRLHVKIHGAEKAHSSRFKLRRYGFGRATLSSSAGLCLRGGL